jgi:signal peptidase
MIVGAYVVSNLVAPKAPTALAIYLVQSAAWIIAAFLVIRFVCQRSLVFWGYGKIAFAGALNGVALIGASVAVGVFSGFGWSPYSHSLSGIALNLWYVGTILVARELCRWVLLDSLRGRGEAPAIVSTWALLSMTDFSLRGFEQLRSPETGFEFVGRVLLPTLAIQFLATYLSWYGGPLASLAYLGALSAFEWFSPILPNHSWLAAAVISTVVPLVGLMSLQADAASDASIEQPEELIGPSPGLLVALAFVVAVFWFNTGITGYQPTIVHGKSMEPTYHTGDLVITKDVDTDSLIVGDVIVFSVGSRNVVHRIIEVRVTDTSRVFITQGDNNDVPDDEVHPATVIGKVNVVIPKIGSPGVAVKHLFTAITR